MLSHRRAVNTLTLGERIKKVRKDLDLTQQEFADRIGMKRNSIAQVEMGRNTSEQTIVSICREFNVNETWLRTGVGDPRTQQSDEDELTAAVNSLLTGESAEFKRRLVRALSTLKDEHWLLLEQKLKEIVGVRDAAPAQDPEHTPTIEEEARAEAEEYYRQILAQKEREAKLSASGHGDSGTVAG